MNTPTDGPNRELIEKCRASQRNPQKPTGVPPPDYRSEAERDFNVYTLTLQGADKVLEAIRYSLQGLNDITAEKLPDNSVLLTAPKRFTIEELKGLLRIDADVDVQVA
ncbi:hypothetical protein KBD59_03410 [Candidatus Gracilibacteria bacterium]|nr:hypothetical protein [Candidatus Gracilibacteria bacterium]